MTVSFQGHSVPGFALGADAVAPAVPSPGSSGNTDVRSPTRTEVRSPTRTATEVRSPTSTSTEAYTQGNFTATVTGGAGAGATTVTIHAPPLNRANNASSKGPRKNAQENENINAPRPDEVPDVNTSGHQTGVSQTPAQASGHPDFVTDWPVSGPTDPGMRTADCWYAKNVLPTPENASCVDCKGPIPMNAIARTGTAGLGEQVSFGGTRMRGFALSAAGDPEIWSKLTADQQGWVMSSLSTLNGLITKTNPGSMCPGWVTPSGASGITAATGCFQMWFDSVYPPGNAVKQLRTDGVFDQDTLDGLKLIASLHPTDFPTPFPGTVATTKKLSTAGMVSIGAGVLTTAGVIYVIAKGGLVGMHKKSRKSRRRK